MSMRIWHQSFTVLEDMGPYAEALRAHLARLTRPDTQVDLHGMAPGTYPSNYPGTDIRHAVAQYLHGTQFLANALRAEAEGYDAFLVCTLPEPALQEIRSVLAIPVIGYLESALHIAATLGSRIGILSFIDDMGELVADNVHRHGLGSRFGAARPVGFGFQDVLAGFTDPQPLLDRFRAAARAMIAGGIDVIIPGELPLCLLLSRNGLSRVDDVPIVDAYATTLLTAEMMVHLRRTLGLAPTRKGYYFTAPPAGRVAELAEYYALTKRYGSV